MGLETRTVCRMMLLSAGTLVSAGRFVFSPSGTKIPKAIPKWTDQGPANVHSRPRSSLARPAHSRRCRLSARQPIIAIGSCTTDALVLHPAPSSSISISGGFRSSCTYCNNPAHNTTTRVIATSSTSSPSALLMRLSTSFFDYFRPNCIQHGLQILLIRILASAIHPSLA